MAKVASSRVLKICLRLLPLQSLVADAQMHRIQMMLEISGHLRYLVQAKLGEDDDQDGACEAQKR